MVLLIIFFVFVILIVVAAGSSKKPLDPTPLKRTYFGLNDADDTPTYEDFIDSLKDATQEELEAWLGPPQVFVEQPEFDWDEMARRQEPEFPFFRLTSTHSDLLPFQYWPQERKTALFWDGELFARYFEAGKIHECRSGESLKFIWAIIEPRTMVFEHIECCDSSAVPERFHQIYMGAEGPKEKWRKIIVPATTRPDSLQNKFQEPMDDLPF